MSDRDTDHTANETAAPAAATKRVFVRSYGCQMNVYDSQRMADALAPEGFVETAEAEDADVVVLNTCHIREKAAEKVYSELGRVRVTKQERAARGLDTTVVVAGCVAQAEGAEVLRRAQVVDVVVGPQAYHRLPSLVADARRGRRLVETDFPTEDKFSALPAPSRETTRARGVSAFVTVQEGCDKFCSFCVVPYTRGAEVSRPVMRVLGEVERLAQAGVREVTLIGQNVNAYHGEGPDGAEWTLARLIARVADIEGIARIRYTTSHPRDMDQALITAHRDIPALMPYLHLPIQSGSDRVLAAMNRKHRAEEYLRIIEKVRAARPDIALSSDFIVGFPGETEAEFEETLALIRAVGFASAFSFKYSARPGTPAADEDDQLGEPVKAERLARLQALLEEQRQAFNAACVGRTCEVLFEKPGRHPGQMAGKSPWLQAVQVEDEGIGPGEIARVRLVEQAPNSFFGEVVGRMSEIAA